MTPELYAATAATIRNCGIRLRPDAQIGELISFMEKNGIELSHTGNQLSGRMGGQPIDIATTISALPTKDELRKHFVVPTDQVHHMSDLTDPKSKAAYIAANGLDSFTKLVAGASSPKLGAVILGPDARAKDVLQWTTKEKVQFVREYGASALGICLARK